MGIEASNKQQLSQNIFELNTYQILRETTKQKFGIKSSSRRLDAHRQKL